MSKFVNLIHSNNNDEMKVLEAKSLEIFLNFMGLVALDGGHELSFQANVEEKPWGVSYGVLVKDAVTKDVIGRLESPMAIVIAPGVYSLQDGSSEGIRAVCFNVTRRREIEE